MNNHRPVIRTVDLTKSLPLGKTVVHALRGVNMDIYPGEMVGIVGPSGSGKSTLLGVIGGLDSPSSGRIEIDGIDITRMSEDRLTEIRNEKIGFVFQFFNLIPTLTALENVVLPIQFARKARVSPNRRAKELLAMLGLSDRLHHRPTELSGGQQQRVAIARALVFEPDLVLLDEPLAALDRKLREEMQLEFRRIQQELGVTTINVTHDQREALVMSDEVLVIDHGRMQQLAPPGEAYRRPANAFVAGFIGVTNFMTGTAVGAAPLRVRFGELESEARIAHPGDGAPAVGTTIDCALRAEHLRIGPGPLHDVDVACAGTVRHVLFEGDRVVYEVDAPALGVSLVRAIDRSPDTHLLLRAGQAVTIGWRARDLLAFPR